MSDKVFPVKPVDFAHFQFHVRHFQCVPHIEECFIIYPVIWPQETLTWHPDSRSEFPWIAQNKDKWSLVARTFNSCLVVWQLLERLLMCMIEKHLYRLEKDPWISDELVEIVDSLVLVHCCIHTISAVLYFYLAGLLQWYDIKVFQHLSTRMIGQNMCLIRSQIHLSTIYKMVDYTDCRASRAENEAVHH